MNAEHPRFMLNLRFSTGETPVDGSLTVTGDDWQAVMQDVKQALAEIRPIHPPLNHRPVTNGPACPVHGKARQGKHGLYCPTKLEDGSWCTWKHNGN